VEIVRAYDGEVFPVAGDDDALKQLFLNLLLNALQAMPAGGTIRVQVQRRELPPVSSAVPRVQIEIEDTGCGITESEREHLFEPFFTTKPQGTGLGLAICQSIAERHQGEIEMYGEPGKGTTACVRIPLVD
jgi:signal transduction histidine kinase